jgi:VanZ family protein
MLRDRKTLLAWLGTLLVVGLCLFPKRSMPVSEGSAIVIPHLDKLIHFGMFGFLGLLWTLALRGPMPLRVTRVFLVTVTLAVGTEIAQGHPLIQRDPDRYDAIADTLGGAAGIAVATAWLRLRAGSEMA